ncbi:hypothetical protein EV421DRAFT_1006287 [Armillaria borealis]|uniref:Uncharacterized protein n=1 Tax=Armillaria borealis TaxID=47425 RepID=A0AA39J8I4_9AGAR|nr:hypothetical protein EV421DRAFT_1006287 [Armillaria borealis]
MACRAPYSHRLLRRIRGSEVVHWAIYGLRIEVTSVLQSLSSWCAPSTAAGGCCSFYPRVSYTNLIVIASSRALLSCTEAVASFNEILSFLVSDVGISTTVSDISFAVVVHQIRQNVARSDPLLPPYRSGRRENVVVLFRVVNVTSISRICAHLSRSLSLFKAVIQSRVNLLHFHVLLFPQNGRMINDGFMVAEENDGAINCIGHTGRPVPDKTLASMTATREPAKPGQMLTLSC